MCKDNLNLFFLGTISMITGAGIFAVIIRGVCLLIVSLK